MGGSWISPDRLLLVLVGLLKVPKQVIHHWVYLLLRIGSGIAAMGCWICAALGIIGGLTVGRRGCDGIGVVRGSVVDSGAERVDVLLLLMTTVAILIVNAIMLLLLL